MNLKRNPLPEHLKLTEKVQGAVQVHENLCQFLHCLIYGPSNIRSEEHQT